MTDNLPVRDDRMNPMTWPDVAMVAVPPQPASPPVRRSAHDHRTLPPDAYIRPTLGDLPLSARLRDAIRMFAEVLQPMVDNFEALQPEVVQCSVCYRNLGGWPPQVLKEHYFQHTWLQRRLAKFGIR
jgi:hypothetical protein